MDICNAVSNIIISLLYQTFTRSVFKRQMMSFSIWKDPDFGFELNTRSGQEPLVIVFIFLKTCNLAFNILTDILQDLAIFINSGNVNAQLILSVYKVSYTQS